MATTPARWRACETSILLIFACAYGLRTKATWSILGKSTSSTYSPCPVSRRGSSLRLIRSPKYRVAINSPITIILGGRASEGVRRDHHISSYLTFESNSLVSIHPAALRLRYRSAQRGGATRPTRYSCPRHRAAECRFTTFELPREDAEGDALVVQFLQTDVATEVFHMDAIVRE